MLAAAAVSPAVLPGTAGAQNPGLTVALYPYVPRVDQFQQAITDAWAAVQPGVPLTFVPTDDWDGGYHDDPDPAWDVFVFDGMYLEYFRAEGFLEAMAPSEIDDRGRPARLCPRRGPERRAVLRDSPCSAAPTSCSTTSRTRRSRRRPRCRRVEAAWASAPIPAKCRRTGAG